MKWEQYRKAIAAVGGAAVTTALTIWSPDTKVGQALVILAAALTALSVYALPNAPATPASEVK